MIGGVRPDRGRQRHEIRNIERDYPLDIKICGLTRAEDARAAELAGARFGGVVLAPGGRRTVSIERAADVFRGSSLLRCGVFVDARIGDLAGAIDALELHVAQLHGDETPEFARAVRSGGVAVWKAVRPRSGADFVREVERFTGSVDGLLLDGWSPLAPGGTGRPFPWREVEPHRHMLDSSVRLIVAGGLNAANVAEAISILRPDVVDVSSGVETSPGIKDPTSIGEFAAVVRGVQVIEGVN